MLALTLVASLLTTAPSTTSPLEEARALLKKGDLDGVLFTLEGKTFEEGQRQDAAVLLASAARESHARKDAILALQFAQMALRLDAQQPVALEAAARAQLANEQFAEAELLADRWIAATDRADAILFRADLALSQADWRRALLLSTSVRERSPSSLQKQQAARIEAAASRELASASSARRELEKLDADLAAAAEKAATESRSSEFASATKARSAVIVYGFKGCGFCTKVMRWLEARSIAYEYKDILEDEAAAAELVEKGRARGVRYGGVPVTDVGGTIVGGARMEELEKAVRAHGLLK